MASVLTSCEESNCMQCEFKSSFEMPFDAKGSMIDFDEHYEAAESGRHARTRANPGLRQKWDLCGARDCTLTFRQNRDLV